MIWFFIALWIAAIAFLILIGWRFGGRD